MITDSIYQKLLRTVYYDGDVVNTRNAFTKSCFDLDPVTFTATPLVTLRKTAWKMALREMEWFMSGNPKCPDELLPWWKDQLNNEQCYIGGYGQQLRGFMSSDELAGFDQVKFILDGLRNNPNSRRLVMTTWNPADMAVITKMNGNQNTPTTCHSSLVQFFVRDRYLHMTSYQRSSDMLLGLPHNWIQSWAMLLYFAHHASLKVGSLRWIFGDAHIYIEDSHLDTIHQLLLYDGQPEVDNSFNLCYNPSVETEGVPVFRMNDFTMEGEIPEPKVITRPKLL